MRNAVCGNNDVDGAGANDRLIVYTTRLHIDRLY